MAIRATYMIAADHAGVDRQGKGIVVGIFDKLLFSPSFPVASFYVLARIEGADAETLPTHWTVEGPGIELQPHPIERDATIPTPHTTALYSMLRVLSPLSEPGEFQVRLWQNDEVVGELLVPIERIEP